MSLSGVLRWLNTRVWPITPLMIAVAVVALLGRGGSLVLQREVTTMLLYMVVVVGYYIFVGNSGIMSFGHVSFMVIGAYAAAIVTLPLERKVTLLPDLPSFLADVEVGPVAGVFIAATVAALFAAIIGIPLNRLTGISLSLSMFAVLLTVNVIVRHWTSLTRGVTSMFGVPQATTLTKALLYALIAIVVAWAFQRTRVGLRMRAAREDEPAARSVGISIARDRYVAFVLSGFFVGMGGALFAQFLGAFNADTFYISTTLLTIAMLVIGGFKSLSGAVVGTLFVSALDAGLRRLEDGFSIGALNVSSRPGLSAVGLALCMLLILILRSDGITGSREIPPLGRRGGRQQPIPGSKMIVESGGKRQEPKPVTASRTPATKREDV